MEVDRRGAFTLLLVGRVDEQVRRSGICEAGWGCIYQKHPTPALRADPPHQGEGKTP